MKKIIFMFLCFIIMPVFSAADYEANIKNGMAAYNQNNLMLSYKYYFLAYKETPSPKLAKVLQFLKAKILAAKAAGQTEVKKADAGFPWKWVLVGADVVCLGLTIAAGVDYNKAADTYDSMYTLLNNTTMDNYALLKKQDETFKSKQGLFVAGAVVTVLLTAYTAADLFFIHAAFPVDTAVSYNPNNNEIKMALNYNF